MKVYLVYRDAAEDERSTETKFYGIYREKREADEKRAELIKEYDCYREQISKWHEKVQDLYKSTSSVYSVNDREQLSIILSSSFPNLITGDSRQHGIDFWQNRFSPSDQIKEEVAKFLVSNPLKTVSYSVMSDWNREHNTFVKEMELE